MKISVKWLRELVDVPAPVEEIARRLTMAGLEVDGVERLDADLHHVVVAEVRSREPVEGTKLSVCRVFDGTTERQIVCGAQNFAAGANVPAALPGAVLPGGKAISITKLRGLDSHGMLCGGSELGVDDGVDGLLLLPADSIPGTPIAALIGRDDVILDLNVTPNRADALSHVGVAREVSALFGTSAKPPHHRTFEDAVVAPAKVASEASDLCSRFCGRVLEGVKVGPSPAWLRQRLEALGQRSINNVVDATNFVMLELGQPLHAYDLDRVAGASLVARRARPGEVLKTLDGKDRACFPEDLVIADAAGPVGLAGVMGGETSEVKDATTRLLLESACFSPSAVRATARRHGIHSEASHRFERGVDPEVTRRAIDRLTEVLLDVAGGRVVGGVVEHVAIPHVRKVVSITSERVDGLLGTAVPWVEVKALLRNLGLGVTDAASGATVEIPGFRVDLAEPHDLVEEVARVRGFESIAPKLPSGSGADALEPATLTAERRLKNAMVSAGYDETLTFAFGALADMTLVRPDVAPVRVRNPLVEDQAVMRTSLVPGILRALSHNLRHGATSVRLAELGRIYESRASAPTDAEGTPGFTILRETRRLVLVAWGSRGRGWTAGKDAADFWDLKGGLETVFETLGISGVSFAGAGAQVPMLHPTSAAAIHDASGLLGHAGELHPTVAKAFDLPGGVFVAELDGEALIARAVVVPKAKGLSMLPPSLRDVAIVVDEKVTAADVAREIAAADTAGLVEEALLFDVYRGAPLPEGRKNLAFALRLRAGGRTLTDDEVNKAHASILERLQTAFGAAPRS